MEFHWESIEGSWRLAYDKSFGNPAEITVKQEDCFWNIYSGECPLRPGNYNSEVGAKRDAWAFAYQNRKSLFDSYHIKLSV